MIDDPKYPSGRPEMPGIVQGPDETNPASQPEDFADIDPIRGGDDVTLADEQLHDAVLGMDDEATTVELDADQPVENDLEASDDDIAQDDENGIPARG